MQYFVLNFTNYTWVEYATSPEVYSYIDSLSKATGIFFIFCSVIALFVKSTNVKVGKILILGSILLMVLSAIFYKEKFYKFGQLIEYSCQMFSPLFLYLILFFKTPHIKLNFLLKVAIALTFLGHGLYALGVYITPGYWTEMAMSSLRFIGLNLSEYAVNQIIFYAGVLDMAIVIGIFLPKKYCYPFLVWAAIWGLLTALSRVIGYTNINPTWDTFFQHLPQTIYRLPHFFIPIAAIAISFIYQNSTKTNTYNVNLQTV